MLTSTDTVVTVGTISRGSVSQRTMAMLMPSSLKFCMATSATSATAYAPNTCGPSRRASMMLIPSPPSLVSAVLPKFQPSAREALLVRVLTACLSRFIPGST